jgi:ABC-type long-subunit fatty acid transport system fused permease/ATPase subunit
MTLPYPPQRPLSVGEVLDLSFRIYRATVVKCLLFSAGGVIAGQLANIYMLASGRAQVKGSAGWEVVATQLRDPPLLALTLIGAVLTLVFYAAVLLRQRQMISEGAAGGEFAAALRRLPALLGLVILIWAACVACFVPAFVTGGGLRILLVLAGIIALSYGFVAISCAMPVLFIEDAGPLASLSRSWRLTTGSFWRLSVIYTVALIVLLVLYVVIAAVAGFLAAILGHGDVAMVTAFAEVVGVALGALATPFYGALALAVLGDLKVRKEGADLEQRISATA